MTNARAQRKGLDPNDTQRQGFFFEVPMFLMLLMDARRRQVSTPAQLRTTAG